MLLPAQKAQAKLQNWAEEGFARAFGHQSPQVRQAARAGPLLKARLRHECILPYHSLADDAHGFLLDHYGTSCTQLRKS